AVSSHTNKIVLKMYPNKSNINTGDKWFKLNTTNSPSSSVLLAFKLTSCLILDQYPSRRPASTQRLIWTFKMSNKGCPTGTPALLARKEGNLEACSSPTFRQILPDAVSGET
ncbi:hypothetical protein L9F63_021273, partial [Diploptera punctata]